MLYRHLLATVSTGLVDSSRGSAHQSTSITPNRIHRWILWTAMGVTVAIGTVFFFVTIFQCRPVRYFWLQAQFPGKGHCLNIDAIINITYVYSAITIVTDFTFALLPVHIVWQLQVDTKTKVVLVPVFAVACIASIACVVRLKYIPKFIIRSRW